MKKDRIRKLAEERIAMGYSRQHIQDELVMMHPEAKPKRIAEVLRYLAPEATRVHFRTYQQLLLAAVILTGALAFGQAVDSALAEELKPWRWFRVIPIATLILGYALYKWRGESLWWLAILNGSAALGSTSALNDLLNGEPDPWTLSHKAMNLLICILAGHLAYRAFPKYEVDKDPLGVAPPRYVFPPEPGLAMMQ
jgi:hypothetical protein